MSSLIGCTSRASIISQPPDRDLTTPLRGQQSSLLQLIESVDHALVAETEDISNLAGEQNRIVCLNELFENLVVVDRLLAAPRHLCDVPAQDTYALVATSWTRQTNPAAVNSWMQTTKWSRLLTYKQPTSRQQSGEDGQTALTTPTGRWCESERMSEHTSAGNESRARPDASTRLNSDDRDLLQEARGVGPVTADRLAATYPSLGQLVEDCVIVDRGEQTSVDDVDEARERLTSVDGVGEARAETLAEAIVDAIVPLSPRDQYNELTLTTCAQCGDTLEPYRAGPSTITLGRVSRTVRDCPSCGSFGTTVHTEHGTHSLTGLAHTTSERVRRACERTRDGPREVRADGGGVSPLVDDREERDESTDCSHKYDHDYGEYDRDAVFVREQCRDCGAERERLPNDEDNSDDDSGSSPDGTTDEHPDASGVGASTLRRLRERAELSQYELADLADMSRSSVYHAEHGRDWVTDNVRSRLLRALLATEKTPDLSEVRQVMADGGAVATTSDDADAEEYWTASCRNITGDQNRTVHEDPDCPPLQQAKTVRQATSRQIEEFGRCSRCSDGESAVDGWEKAREVRCPHCGKDTDNPASHIPGCDADSEVVADGGSRLNPRAEQRRRAHRALGELLDADHGSHRQTTVTSRQVAGRDERLNASTAGRWLSTLCGDDPFYDDEPPSAVFDIELWSKCGRRRKWTVSDRLPDGTVDEFVLENNPESETEVVTDGGEVVANRDDRECADCGVALEPVDTGENYLIYDPDSRTILAGPFDTRKEAREFSGDSGERVVVPSDLYRVLHESGEIVAWADSSPNARAAYSDADGCVELLNPGETLNGYVVPWNEQCPECGRASILTVDIGFEGPVSDVPVGELDGQRLADEHRTVSRLIHTPGFSPAECPLWWRWASDRVTELWDECCDRSSISQPECHECESKMWKRDDDGWFCAVCDARPDPRSRWQSIEESHEQILDDVRDGAGSDDDDRDDDGPDGPGPAPVATDGGER